MGSELSSSSFHFVAEILECGNAPWGARHASRQGGFQPANRMLFLFKRDPLFVHGMWGSKKLVFGREPPVTLPTLAFPEPVDVPAAKGYTPAQCQVMERPE